MCVTPSPGVLLVLTCIKSRSVQSTTNSIPEKQPVVRERTFEFVKCGGSDDAPWVIEVNDGGADPADPNGIPAAPAPGTSEIWHLVNGGSGWNQPIHIDFEEGQTIVCSSKLLAEGDASGLAPLAKPRDVLMPPLDLSESELSELLSLLESSETIAPRRP